MTSRFLITGCSGGGKSTVAAHLKKRGYYVVREPGMRVIEQGGSMPRENRTVFIEAVTEISRQDLADCVPISSRREAK